jgi:hypothetical protein
MRAEAPRWSRATATPSTLSAGYTRHPAPNRVADGGADQHGLCGCASASPDARGRVGREGRATPAEVAVLGLLARPAGL